MDSAAIAGVMDLLRPVTSTNVQLSQLKPFLLLSYIVVRLCWQSRHATCAVLFRTPRASTVATCRFHSPYCPSQTHSQKGGWPNGGQQPPFSKCRTQGLVWPSARYGFLFGIQHRSLDKKMPPLKVFKQLGDIMDQLLGLAELGIVFVAVTVGLSSNLRNPPKQMIDPF